jgi:hypothetical protein
MGHHLDDMWVVLAKQFEFVEDALLYTGVETEEEALGIVNTDDSRAKRVPFLAIRYRGTSGDNDQRDYFLSMGRDLCDSVREAIKRRELTPAFVQEWGMVMFCHGYIATHIFDDTDPMVSKRSGRIRGQQVSRHAQRKWLSHIILGLQEKGFTRARAEQRAAEIIQEIIARGEFPEGFDRAWFEVMCTYSELASTYAPTKLTRKLMVALRAEPQDDIPPIPPLP